MVYFLTNLQKLFSECYPTHSNPYMPPGHGLMQGRSNEQNSIIQTRRELMFQGDTTSLLFKGHEFARSVHNGFRQIINAFQFSLYTEMSHAQFSTPHFQSIKPEGAAGSTHTAHLQRSEVRLLTFEASVYNTARKFCADSFPTNKKCFVYTEPCVRPRNLIFRVED